MNFNTSLLHAGVDKKEKYGSTLTPIYQTSAFFQTSAEDLAGIFSNRAPGYCYTRVANPTVGVFENRITKLENGLGSVATSSGMSAIFNALTNILQSGDEILSSSSLYGGTIDLFRDLEAFGIKTVYFKNNDFEGIERSVTENTKLIFAETIGNPCLDVTDIDTLAGIAHSHGIPLIIDNTVATQYLIRVLDHGADIVINSTSKYINGSSNAIGGILTDSGHFKWNAEKFPVLKEYLKFGPFAYLSRLRAGLQRNAGACMAPQTAFLNQIGLETMGLRMERQCTGAALLAKHLEDEYPEVTVNYPGLESSRWHGIADKVLKGGYGAIVTIRVGSREKAFDVINNMELAYRLSNIGDTKTLVLHPASTISLHSTEKQKEDAGVFDDLIRISVGIEDIEDLISDFDKAFEKTGIRRK